MDKSQELYSKERDNSSRFEGKTVPWEHTIGPRYLYLYLYGYVVTPNSGFYTTVKERCQLLLTKTVECGLEGLDRLGAHYVILKLVPFDNSVHEK